MSPLILKKNLVHCDLVLNFSYKVMWLIIPLTKTWLIGEIFDVKNKACGFPLEMYM